MSESLTLVEFQRLAMRTASTDPHGRDALLCSALGIAGEAGEVADLVKKATFHRVVEAGPLVSADLRARLIDEMGDVLWYLAWLAETIDTTLNTVAVCNVAKLRRRYPTGFDPRRSPINLCRCYGGQFTVECPIHGQGV